MKDNERVLIASDCTGGFIYKWSNHQYDNPFIWVSMDLSDMIYLIKNINTIDFRKYEIHYDETLWRNELPEGSICPVLTIDSHVHLYFSHHLYHPNYNETKVVERRYLSNKINSMICQRYEKHVERFIQAIRKKPPFFMYVEYTNDVDLMEFVNLETPFIKILVTHSLSLEQCQELMKEHKMIFITKPGFNTSTEIRKFVMNYLVENDLWNINNE